MAKIPTYDNFQAQEQVQPNVQVQAPQGPTPGAIAAQQQDAMGKGMLGLGNQVAIIAAKEQALADTSRVQDASNQLDRFKVEQQISALKLEGRAALERPDGKSLMDEGDDALKKKADEIAGTLGNAQQRDLFTKYSSSLRNQFYTQLGSHVMQQQKAFDDATDKETVNAAVNTAGLLWGDAQEVATQKSKIETVLKKRIAQQGLTPEKDGPLIESMRTGALSAMHSAVLTGMLQGGNASDAEAYYKNNKTEMTLAARSTMSEGIKNKADAQAGIGAATEVFAKTMVEVEKETGQGLNAPIPLSKMAEALKARFTDSNGNLDVGKYNASYAEVVRMTGNRNKDQSEFEASGVERFFQARQGGMSLSKIKSDPTIWGAISAKNRTTLEEQVLRHEEAKASMDITRMRRELARQELNAAPAMFGFYSEPDSLTKMSDAQIKQLAPTIGYDNALKLMDRRKMLLASDAKLSEGKIDTDTFNSVAESAGLPIKPKNDKDKAVLARMRDTIETNIGIRQQSIKRELTREERDAEIQRVVHDRVKNPNTWLVFGGDETISAITPPETLLKSTVPVKVPTSVSKTGSTNLVIGSIPRDEYEMVYNKLRSAGGRVPTTQEVAQNWSDWKNAGNK